MSLKGRELPNEGSLKAPRKRRKVDLEEGSNFDRLPDEMVELILDFVRTPSNEGTETENVRLVCRRWNNIITPRLNYHGEVNDITVNSFVQLDPELEMRTLVLSGMKNNRVRRCRRRTRRQTKGSLPWTRSNNVGGKDYDPRLFKRSVEHLIVGGEAGIFLKRHEGDQELPYSMSTGFAEDHRVLQNLRSSIKGADLVNILAQIQNVKTLTLSSLAFLSVSMYNIKKMNFPRQYSTLTTLDLCIGRKTDPTKLALMFELCTFPFLSSLYIRVYSLTYHFSIVVNFYRFISKHPMLKNLSLSQAQAVYGLPNLDCSYPSLQVSAHPEMVEKLMEIKLQCLRMDCLVIGQDIGDQWKTLEIAFIKNQTNLRGLELQLNLRSLNCRLDEMIPACGKTLERLELSSCNIAPNSFDCSTISTFSKLKDCHLYLRNYFYTGNNDDLRIIRISDIHMLPSSIESLHLGRLPNMFELWQLKGRLVNLKRISYSCADLAHFHVNPRAFVEVLLEHLRFPCLVEFRMYQYACPTVAEFLHRQDGLVSYIEDEDSVVVLVDKDEFDLEVFSKCISSVSECTCEQCMK